MPENFSSFLQTVFPAGAGVILVESKIPSFFFGVSRRRGGDPCGIENPLFFLRCFPQAGG